MYSIMDIFYVTPSFLCKTGCIKNSINKIVDNILVV